MVFCHQLGTEQMEFAGQYTHTVRNCTGFFLQQSDGSVVQGGEAVLVGADSVSKPVALQQGFAALPEGEGDILVRQGEDFCLLRTNAFYSGMPDDGADKQPELRAMVWTDRNLYRPGEKVYVRGFLRAVDGKNNIAHSQHRELELNFDAPDGRRLSKRDKDLDLGELGRRVTPEQLIAVLGELTVDEAVTAEIDPKKVVRAPGMKYLHYAPQAPVVIISGSRQKAADYIRHFYQPGERVMCFEEELELYEGCDPIAYGREEDVATLSAGLFDVLRELDRPDIPRVYARCPVGGGLAFAVQNRLKKAAGFHIIDAEEIE